MFPDVTDGADGLLRRNQFKTLETSDDGLTPSSVESQQCAGEHVGQTEQY